MRFAWIVTLALVAAAMPAGAQKNKAVKPSHEDRTKSSGAVKAPHNSGSLQLQKLEQQTAKSAGGGKNSSGQRPVRVKTEREKGNPPIHFTSGTGGRGSGGSVNSSKSRVRTKNKH